MTYDQDPARWTSSPEEAPELLRGAFAAGRNEGPSQAQMRSLAIKIAAVSAGGAVAVGAAKATAAGNAAATAASWSVGKLAGVLAIAGSIAAGAAIWKADDVRHGAPAAKPVHSAPAVEEPSALPAPEIQARATAENTGATAGVDAPGPASAAAIPVAAPESAGSTRPAPRSVSASGPASSVTVPGQRGAASSRAARKSATSSARAAEASASPASRSSTITSASAAPRAVSEVELLRSAQQALRSRPREAYQITEQHRQLYPAGEFAQERDALAIQALLRAGETEMARDLAVSFIKAHPRSPHAHQFREAMGIR